MRGDREVAAREAHHGVVLDVNRLLFLLERDLDAGVNEKNAEEVEDPFETVNQGRADPDDRATHDEGTEDSPEEHTMLRGRRYAKHREDQDEYEEIVDAQRILDDVTGEELESRRRSPE